MIKHTNTHICTQLYKYSNVDLQTGYCICNSYNLRSLMNNEQSRLTLIISQPYPFGKDRQEDHEGKG